MISMTKDNQLGAQIAAALLLVAEPHKRTAK